MDRKLITMLEQYAEETSKQSQRDHNERRRAYKEGKAEGLMLARDLLEIVSEFGLYPPKEG